MTEQPRHEPAADLRQVRRILGIEERVAVSLEKGDVRVHAAPPLALDRLGHERRVRASLLRDLLHDEAVRHNVVRHRESVGETQVDLVLRRGDLVVRVLDRDADALEHLDGCSTEVLCVVERRHVEVRAGVERLGGSRGLEKEELHLGVDVEREAHRARALEVAPKDQPRVAGERRPVGRGDIAEHARLADAAVHRGQDLERRRVRDRDHVRLLDAREAFDRAAVESHAVLEGGLELGGRDRE